MEILTTIVIWTAGIAAGLLGLAVLAGIVLLWIMAGANDGDWQGHPDKDERADNDPYLIHSAARAKYPDSALIRDMHKPVGM